MFREIPPGTVLRSNCVQRSRRNQLTPYLLKYEQINKTGKGKQPVSETLPVDVEVGEKNPCPYELMLRNPHSYFVVALNHKRKDESVLPRIQYVITAKLVCTLPFGKYAADVEFTKAGTKSFFFCKSQVVLNFMFWL